jgi:hypothetical protein
MMSLRRTALIAGLLYLVTFVASIPALPLLAPVLNDPRFILGNGSAVAVTTGALLDLINAAACVGTALVLYPVLRRHGPVGALGFVTSRVLEAAIIIVGVLSLLAVVSLRARGVSDPASAQQIAAALVALRDGTFLIGPGLMPAVNALLLGSVLLRSRLVPRLIPLLGLVGAPLQLASVVATVYGVNSQLSVWSAIAVVPIFFWELAVGLWMTFRGFTPPATPVATH